MAKKIEIEQTDPQGLDRIKNSDRPFSKINYYLMGGCIVLIVLGFILMSGGGSSIENGFNPEIFSTRRIIIGPAFSFLGFLLMAFAIIYTPKSRRIDSKVSADISSASEVVASDDLAEGNDPIDVATANGDSK